MNSEDPARNKGGRPQHEPTEKMRQQITLLAGLGLSQDGIAQVVGLTGPTLRKHYKKELASGAHQANAKVAASLYSMATSSSKPNVAAAIFWLKTRAGWREAEAAPPFVEERPPRLGKKEEANLNAVTAQVGTTWEALLGPDPRRLN
jgi:hypothetical protein